MTEDTDRKLHESPEYRQEQLSAALDGMLMPDEQVVLDAHLAGCDSCAREFEELRQVREMMRALPQPALPRSFMLPLEGELVASGAPEREVRHGLPSNVTPMSQASRGSRRASRTLLVARWLGTVAAVLGMALFLGTLLPNLGPHAATSSAGSPMYGAQSSIPDATDSTRSADQSKLPSPTNGLANGGVSPGKSVTATASASAPYTGSTAETHIAVSQGPSLGEILRIVALVLLFGGVVLLLLSWLVARLA